MIQELRKLSANDDNEKASPTPKKKSKTSSSHQQESPKTSAMMATSSNQSHQSNTKKPQSCRHCGKFVIHTDGICDVYNVPSANIASSGLTDTPHMSVVFQNMDFENEEYIIAYHFGIIDDLTLENHLSLVPPQV